MSVALKLVPAHTLRIFGTFAKTGAIGCGVISHETLTVSLAKHNEFAKQLPLKARTSTLDNPDVLILEPEIYDSQPVQVVPLFVRY